MESLAHHALRGEVWHKAVLYLRQAGAKAAARGANREAVGFLEQALAALSHLPESVEQTEQAIDLRLDLRPPVLQMGQLERVLTLSQEAEAMAQRLGDERRLARVYSYLVNYHYLKGEPDLAMEYGERCLRIGEAVRTGHCKLWRAATWATAITPRESSGRPSACCGRISTRSARRRPRT